MTETSAGRKVFQAVRGAYIVTRTAIAATGVVLGGVMLLRGIKAAREHFQERPGRRN